MPAKLIDGLRSGTTTRAVKVSAARSPVAAGKPASSSQLVGLAVLQAVEAQRVAAGRHDAVERGLAAHKGAIGNVALGRDLLVEAQAGARRLGLGLDLDLGDAERDEPLQLLDPLGDRRRTGVSARPASKAASASFCLSCRS